MNTNLTPAHPLYGLDPATNLTPAHPLYHSTTAAQPEPVAPCPEPTPTGQYAIAAVGLVAALLVTFAYVWSRPAPPPRPQFGTSRIPPM